MAACRTDSYPVRTIKNRYPNRRLRISIFLYSDTPGVQFGLRNAQHSALRAHPKRMIVVFHRPMNRFARQSILAGKRGDLAVFQATEPAVSGGPQHAVLIE